MSKKHTMPSRLIELEHELAAAIRQVDEQSELLRLCKEENEEKRLDIIWTMGERAKLKDRVQQLEEAGDDLHDGWWGNRNNMDRYSEAWRKAKDAKP